MTFYGPQGLCDRATWHVHDHNGSWLGKDLSSDTRILKVVKVWVMFSWGFVYCCLFTCKWVRGIGSLFLSCKKKGILNDLIYFSSFLPALFSSWNSFFNLSLLKYIFRINILGSIVLFMIVDGLLHDKLVFFWVGIKTNFISNWQLMNQLSWALGVLNFVGFRIITILTGFCFRSKGFTYYCYY